MALLVAPRPLPLSELREALSPVGARLVGEASLSVSSLTEDSRLVQSGSLFVARRGERVDATRFAPAALAQGAAAVLCEPGIAEAVVPRLEVDDLPRAFGLAAQFLAGQPSSRLATIGITGTNGKTTVASLLDQALSHLGGSVARLGTLGFEIAGRKFTDTLTTPQPDELARIFLQALEEGASDCVMEVSSHALEQWRVAGVQFAVAAFTNLTQDHLDYHGTMEAYGAAKAKLFTACAPGAAVINVDDGFGQQLKREVPGALAVSAGLDSGADLVAKAVVADRQGTRFDVSYAGQLQHLQSPLLGSHNVENLLVALGVLLKLEHPLDAACRALSQAVSVPGRMERCDAEGDDLTVLVDYAHTPDALYRALTTLKRLSPPRLICVFGCGGDRDREKRPLMGRAAAELADELWITSDNPRSEDPSAILKEIVSGLPSERTAATPTTCVEVDRHQAIASAIADAPTGSMILIAGKGHETYQLVQGQVLDFDDRVEVRNALKRRSGGAS